MYTNKNMKPSLRSIVATITLFGVLLESAYAQTATTILSGEAIFQRVIDSVFNPLYELITGIAAVYFLYGVAMFIYQFNDPEKKTTGKRHLLWGTVGLFIMLSVGGILPIINSVLGGMFQF
jgi:hypothetical protein